MTKAILKNGVFQPIGPLSVDWIEGTEVAVEKSGATTLKSHTDEWMDEVERAASECDLEDGRILIEAVEEIRRDPKELTRQGRR